jgi:hypothetical protein
VSPHSLGLVGEGGEGLSLENKSLQYSHGNIIEMDNVNNFATTSEEYFVLDLIA